MTSLMAKKGEPLTIPPDASTPSACNCDTAAVTVDRASASASCQIWSVTSASTTGPAPKTPDAIGSANAASTARTTCTGVASCLASSLATGSALAAISEPSSGTTIRETTTVGSTSASCGSDHDLFVRLTLGHHLLHRDLGSREQRRGLIRVRLGRPGPGVLDFLDGALGADEGEERIGVSGLRWDDAQQDDRSARAGELLGPMDGAQGTSRSINWSKNDGHPSCSYAEPDEPLVDSRARWRTNQSRATA